jgi:hypothetical protein
MVVLKVNVASSSPRLDRERLVELQLAVLVRLGDEPAVVAEDAVVLGEEGVGGADAARARVAERVRQRGLAAAGQAAADDQRALLAAVLRARVGCGRAAASEAEAPHLSAHLVCPG